MFCGLFVCLFWVVVESNDFIKMICHAWCKLLPSHSWWWYHNASIRGVEFLPQQSMFFLVFVPFSLLPFWVSTFIIRTSVLFFKKYFCDISKHHWPILHLLYSPSFFLHFSFFLSFFWFALLFVFRIATFNKITV